MRVALVNRLAGIHRGGGEVYDLRLAEALRRAGIDLEIVTARPLLGAPRAPVTEVPVRYARTPYLRGIAHRLGRAGWRIFDLDLRLFEAEAFRLVARGGPRPDLVQVTGLPDLARRLETEGGLPTVLLFPGPPSPRHAAAIRACRTVVGVGAVTAYLRETFRDDVHDATAGVDLERFSPGIGRVRERLGFPPEARVVLFAGRLVPLKNIPLLVDAFSGIRRAEPRARLLVAGDGPLRGELAAGARRLGLRVGAGGADADVVLAGDSPHEAMPAIYAAADLLLLTSLNESFSLVVLEAMACGLPVVVPAVGYLPRLVEDGVTGVLYGAGDGAALVRESLRLLADPGLRGRLGTAARAAAGRRHSWDAVAADFAALYRKVLAP